MMSILTIVVVLVLKTTTASSQWYPANFATPGGEEICISDGKHPNWMEENGYITDSLAACCIRYFNYSNSCTPAPNVTDKGSGKYYPKLQENTCAKDCDVSLGGDCGGILSISNISAPLVTFTTLRECCDQYFGQLDINICIELASPSTNNGTTSVLSSPSPSSIVVNEYSVDITR